jgi:transposase
MTIHTHLDSDTRRRPPRKTYSAAFKRRVVEQTLQPGTSVSLVAREHGINANVIFGWRKQYRNRMHRVDVSAPPAAALLPVSIIEPTAVASDDAAPVTTPSCQVEVEIGKRRVRICGLTAAVAMQFLRDYL